jgi:hypothetical protein
MKPRQSLTLFAALVATSLVHAADPRPAEASKPASGRKDAASIRKPE